MTHEWWVKGLHLEVLSIHQNKPHTMAHLRHVSNGVTYEARGWTRWDGKDEWSNGRGRNIALKRARRKIAARLKWEANLVLDCRRLLSRKYETRCDLNANRHQQREVDNLHRDGGTVQL